MSARFRFFLGASAVALFGMVLLAYATQSGPGLSPDSRGYLQAARFILQGRGICNINGNGEVVPLTHFAPLYPILLAAFGVGGDPLDRARALGIVIFGINIILGGWIVFRAAGRSALGGIIGSVLVAVSLDMLRVHVMVWSEPAFITFLLAALLLMATYLDSLKIRWLILGACAVACAFLMRYSGASLVMAMGLVLLIFPSRRLQRRITDGVLFGAISILPMLVWIVRNRIKAGNAADRASAVHPPNWHDIQLSLFTFASWIVPTEKGSTAIAILIAVVAIVVTVPFLMRRKPTLEADAPNRPLRWLLPGFVIVYLLFLLFSVSFVDAHTPLDYRILAPLYVCLILWLAGLALQESRRERTARLIIAIALAAFIGSHIGRSAAWARATSREGIGYGAKVWRDSPTLAWIKHLPANTLLYSNAPDLIDFRTSRFAKPVPKVMDPITRKPEKTYAPYLQGLREDLTARGGYIIWFKTRSASRWYLVTEEQIRKDLSLQTVQTFHDGTVYELPK
jgi:hypothetical protein